MDRQFKNLYENHPDYDIWITGHSLGGAMASLAAHYIKNEFQIPENKIKLITFGQPRTGDYGYAHAFDAQVGHSVSYITSWHRGFHPVPYCPNHI
ncbi:unnamed protein product [Cylicostephanus goldi]|uniref:Fungal lipase-type domain-containing protein n=1 Tax=Cylicostephanus goldi TaxID=71465 RepID=A0A3P7MKX5_CYLGO|nr:unnamed protein product [Cylicostephanus goldi]